MSGLVGNPEDRFSRVAAQIIIRICSDRVAIIIYMYIYILSTVAPGVRKYLAV